MITARIDLLVRDMLTGCEMYCMGESKTLRLLGPEDDVAKICSELLWLRFALPCKAFSIKSSSRSFQSFNDYIALIPALYTESAFISHLRSDRTFLRCKDCKDVPS